jgi:hypothetical protein
LEHPLSEAEGESKTMPWDKDRYAADPAFRKHVLEKNKAHRAVHKDEINARRRQKYATDPEFKAKLLACNSLSRRESKLKMKYGMTLAEYNAEVARQGGICPICLQRPEEKLCVDHHHKTRTLRSLLCRKCNIGLGCYNDDPASMRRAADYLDYWLAEEGRARTIPSAKSGVQPTPARSVCTVPAEQPATKTRKMEKTSLPPKSPTAGRTKTRSSR